VFTKKVTSFIHSNSLISLADHIIVALSGGRDSISLLYVLDSIKENLKFTLSAVHVNHGIRGGESDGDEKFAIETCKAIHVECSTYRLSGFKITASENALRIARYEKFDLESAKFNNCKIATS